MSEETANTTAPAPNDDRSSGSLSRRSKVGISLAMLAVPALYLAWAWPHGSAVNAGSAQAAAAIPGSAKLAQLEAQARANPTEANRLNLSQEYINQGMQARAIGVLNALVAEYPHSALGWNNLCVAHTLQQEYNLAIAACQAGIRADGSVQLLHNNLKWAEDERAKVVSALAEEEHVPDKDRSEAFYLNEGMNELHLGAYDEAIKAWQNCLALNPRNGNALNDVGVALMMQSQPLKAEASFREALAIEPGNQLYRNNLQWALNEAAAK